MKWIFGPLLLMGICLSAHSEDRFVRGEGRFYSTQDDSVNFVKRQLIYSATKDVISRSLRKLNLDPVLFWENYELKFQEDFDPVVENLKLKYKEGEESQSQRQKEAFKRILRLKKLSAKRKFGSLGRVLTSYSIKKQSRSPQNPNSRYLTLEARVNQKKLYGVYHRFISGGANRKISKIYISTKFSIPQGDWSLLGVESASDFIEAVNDHWKRWFLEKSGLDLEEVEIASGSKIESLEEQMRTNSKDREMIAALQTGAINSGESSAEAETMTPASSLWANLQFKFQLIESRKLLKSIAFSVSGDFALYDLKTGKAILLGHFPPNDLKYHNLSSDKLASQLASYIYRLPLPRFEKAKGVLSKLPSVLKQRKIQVHNVSNYSEVSTLKKLIQKGGVTMMAQLQEYSMTKNNVLLSLEYQGEDQKLLKMMTKLRGRMIGNKRISFPYENNPFYILLSSSKSNMTNYEKEILKQGRQ